MHDARDTKYPEVSYEEVMSEDKAVLGWLRKIVSVPESRNLIVSYSMMLIILAFNSTLKGFALSRVSRFTLKQRRN